MENAKFDRLLCDANTHLDMLDKIVHDAVEVENEMIQNILNTEPEMDAL